MYGKNPLNKRTLRNKHPMRGGIKPNQNFNISQLLALTNSLNDFSDIL